MEQLKTITSSIRGMWKAVVAAVAPLVVDVATDILSDAVDTIALSRESILTAAVSALAVYWKSNLT